ncbi:hypothetical protein GGI20_005185 [Coemansia sp. BCRC 34301]|nr:hypothetical protein GGI20_005185 [Coemansia sp. BCRC 34301]
MAPLYFEKPVDTPSSEFMNFDILKTSFHQTLTACLPHALGTNLRTSTDGDLAAPLLVTVNSAAPRLPVVTRHKDSECTIALMRASGFMPHVQPKALLERTAPLTRNPMGGDPLATLDVVYMSDGVGVLLVLSHAVVDMAAYCRFCIEWGLATGAMRGKGAVAGVVRAMDTDRSRFWAQVSAHTPAADPSPFEKHLEEFRKTNYQLQAEEAGDNTTVAFRLSADVAGMARLAQTRDAECAGISVPNFVSALLWRIVARASSSAAEFAWFSASLTIRSQRQFADYWGNTATAKYIHAQTKAVAQGDLRLTAGLVQSCVRDFGVAEFARIVGLYAGSDGGAFLRNVSELIGTPRVARLSVANISRIPFYSVDFGHGGPVKVQYQTVRIPGLCFVMPQSADGGMEVLVCLSEAAGRALINDETIQSHFIVETVG